MKNGPTPSEAAVPVAGDQEVLQSIAHDLNNLMSCVAGNAELLDSGAIPQRDACRAIAIAIDRAQVLVGRLFHLRARSKEGLLDLAELLRDLEPMLECLVAGSERFGIELPEMPVVVRGKAHDLELVAFNLVMNAAEAARGTGGFVCIQLQSLVGVVELSVSDSGPGIPTSQRQALFEPGTSSNGEGRGLGLAFVHAAVERLGGRIDAENTSVGARFIVEIPHGEEVVCVTGSGL